MIFFFFEDFLFNIYFLKYQINEFFITIAVFHWQIICSQTRLIWPRGQVIEKTKTNPFPLRQRGGECRRQSAVLRNQPRENVIFSLVLICVSKFLVRLIHQVSVKIQKVSNISPFCRTATFVSRLIIIPITGGNIINSHISEKVIKFH